MYASTSRFLPPSARALHWNTSDQMTAVRFTLASTDTPLEHIRSDHFIAVHLRFNAKPTGTHRIRSLRCGAPSLQRTDLFSPGPRAWLKRTRQESLDCIARPLHRLRVFLLHQACTDKYTATYHQITSYASPAFFLWQIDINISFDYLARINTHVSERCAATSL